MANKEYRNKTSKYSKENGKQISFFTKFRIIFGGALGIIGIFFTILGLIVSSVFISLISFDDIKLLMGNAKTEGKLISVEGTNSIENDKPVFEYKYSFAVKNKEYKNSSYKTGRVTFAYKRVSVEYKENNPKISRIEGMKSGQFPILFVLIPLIFPIVGILMLLFAFKKGLKHIKLVRFGKVAYGTFSHMENANEKINNQTVYKMFFNFTVDGKPYTAVGKTHKTHKLKDEQQEPLLYDINSPSNAIMIDSLPASVRKMYKKELYTEKETASRF